MVAFDIASTLGLKSIGFKIDFPSKILKVFSISFLFQGILPYFVIWSGIKSMTVTVSSKAIIK